MYKIAFHNVYISRQNCSKDMYIWDNVYISKKKIINIFYTKHFFQGCGVSSLDLYAWFSGLT